MFRASESQAYMKICLYWTFSRKPMLFKEMGVILVVAIIVILSLLAKITNIAMTLYRLKLAS
jgi:hypothetical protein